MLRWPALSPLVLAVAVFAPGVAAGAVVLHQNGTQYEDGVAGKDADGQVNNVVEWSSGDVHVVMGGYVVLGPFDFNTNAYVKHTLVIRPGAIVKFAASCTLNPDQSIQSCLTDPLGGARIYTPNISELRIKGATLTDIRDDSVGGDTNNNGSATVPTSSDYWIRFGGHSTEVLESNLIRWAAMIGHFGSIRIEGNTFEKFGGIASMKGSGAVDTSPILFQSAPTITGNTFEIVANSYGPGAVDMRGVSANIVNNTFTGQGTAIRIGPTWLDWQARKKAIPLQGRTRVHSNTIHTSNGIWMDLPPNGTVIHEQVRFVADIRDNLLSGPTTNGGGIGLNLVMPSQVTVERNRVENYERPLSLINDGASFPSAAAIARMGLEIHDNEFSLLGATPNYFNNYDSVWMKGGFVRAERNWWGHETGPYDPYFNDGLYNPRGEGIPISNGIDYVPYVGTESFGEEFIHIDVVSDPLPPLATNATDVLFLVDVDSFDLGLAPTGAITVYLRNQNGDVLNPPGETVQVTSSQHSLETLPILLPSIPEFTGSVDVDAVLVPTESGGTEFRSNVVSHPVDIPTGDFALCVTGTTDFVACAPLTLFPGRAHQTYFVFVYTYSGGGVNFDLELDIRNKNTGEVLQSFPTRHFPGEAGFERVAVDDLEINVPHQDVTANPPREVHARYRVRDEGDNLLAIGSMIVPVLENGSEIRLESVAAVDGDGDRRGMPGYLLTGEKARVKLDVRHGIEDPAAMNWSVVATQAEALNSDDFALATLQMTPSPMLGGLAEGSALNKNLTLVSDLTLPAGTVLLDFAVDLKTSVGVTVARENVQIPVRSAEHTISKTIPAGASTTSFSPAAIRLKVDANTNQFLTKLSQFVGNAKSQQRSLPAERPIEHRRAARAVEETELIPIERYWGIYDTMTSGTLSATLEFTYDPATDFPDDPAFDEDTLTAAAINPLTGKLEVLPSTLDKGANTVETAYDGFFDTWTLVSQTVVPASTCGDPTSDGEVTAADALFALRAGVGTRTCDLCVCDVNRNGTVTSTDALVILRHAVGATAAPTCDACDGI
jgi:hypothetical protein